MKQIPISACAMLVSVACACAGTTRDASPATQATFVSPQAAVSRLSELGGTYDFESITELFGSEGVELLHTGDEVADREDVESLQELIREKVDFEDHGAGILIALLGKDAWPLPIPLVRVDGGWRFDTARGREEVENRRVGRNELSTIATLHAYVDAQREYASKERDGLPVCYARRVFSSPGKHDGLYWPTDEGGEESPFGPLVADAAGDGYAPASGGPKPFHGYRYRVLTAQGPNAPGGSREYVDELGRMTRGFAMLAWPAKYGSSGVMTFQVDKQGIVYQSDLGENTERAVEAIKAFDVDASWDPTGS